MKPTNEERGFSVQKQISYLHVIQDYYRDHHFVVQVSRAVDSLALPDSYGLRILKCYIIMYCSPGSLR